MTAAELLDFPDPGPVPRLTWLDIDHLEVDHRYQRTAEAKQNRAAIKAIAEGFCWAKFQPITVCPVEEQRFAILDGQHRWEAAKMHPGINQVPCYVVAVPELRDQAGTFVGINRDRIKVHPLQLHHAQIAAGDPDALHIRDVCAEAGVTIPRSAQGGRSMPPKHTMALETIRKGLRNYGDAPVVRALRSMVEAFPETPGQMRAQPLGGLILLFAAHRDTIDEARLVKVLAAMDMEDLENKARAFKDAMGGTTQAATVAALRKAYNKGLGAASRLAESE